MTFKSFRTLTAVVLTCASFAVLASGSDGGGAAETGDAQAYNMGKMVYAQKVACSTCAMPGKALDMTVAKQILSGKPISGLSEDESRALAVYLTRRFKL